MNGKLSEKEKADTHTEILHLYEELHKLLPGIYILITFHVFMLTYSRIKFKKYDSSNTFVKEYPKFTKNIHTGIYTLASKKEVL